MNRHAALFAAALLTASSAAHAADDPKKPATPPPVLPAPPAPAGAAEVAVEIDLVIKRDEAKLEAAQAELQAREAAVRAEREAADAAAAGRAPARFRRVAPAAGVAADQFGVVTAFAGQRVEKGAYLGINANPAQASLRHQLKLAKGTGLVVEHVVPDSPAAAAGLLQHDVIVRLDDQLLVNTQQFVVLIRAHKPNDELKLSIVRQGQPSEIKIKVAEKDLPPLDEQGNAAGAVWTQPVVAPFDLGVVHALNVDGNVVFGGGGEVRIAPPAAPVPGGRIVAGQDKMVLKDNNHHIEIERKGNDRIAKIFDVKTGKLMVEGPANSPDVQKAMPVEVVKRVEMLQAQAAAADRGVVFLSKTAARRNQEINWSDGEKDYHIFAKDIDGKRETRLVVKDIAGRVLFEGPIDTGDQRKQLPDDIAEKLTQALLANVPVKP